MTNIWCIGSRYEYLKTNTAVASSVDGQIWQNIHNPFPPPDSSVSICYHNSALIAIGTNGQIAYSNDLNTWQNGTIGVDGMCVTGSISTNKIVACGRRHYLADQDGYQDTTEVGQIFDSITGEPDTWAMIFSAANTPSGFRNIKYWASADIGDNIDAPICVVVGDKIGLPWALYSQDLGQTWTEISIDPDLSEPFFDVEYDISSKRWYFATGGTIAIADNLIDPTWTSTEIFSLRNLPVTKIKINPEGEMIALNGSTIWYSGNLDNWIPFTLDGYQWRSVEWFDSKWVVGTESLLTQYTFWTSTNGLDWTPGNNNIQMLSLVIES